jgi:NAD(P)-dependent dehydrogenase (short-subunit alcohol dehydrogenase family)
LWRGNYQSAQRLYHNGTGNPIDLCGRAHHCFFNQRYRQFPTYGPYIASKVAVEGLVHVLANELCGRNITINAVAPGHVATELFLVGKSEAQIDQMSKLPPLECLGQPEDIANIVSFLAVPEGGWANAQVLRANGGFACYLSDERVTTPQSKSISDCQYLAIRDASPGSDSTLCYRLKPL